MRRALALATILAAASSGAALAATKLTTFQVRITVQSSCTILSASALDAASAGRFSGRLGLPQVQCTIPVPHSTAVVGATTQSGGGMASSVTVDGRAPTSSTPAPGVRADTIVVTVTF
jgi:spore coat protein U-like protein